MVRYFHKLTLLWKGNLNKEEWIVKGQENTYTYVCVHVCGSILPVKLYEFLGIKKMLKIVKTDR